MGNVNENPIAKKWEKRYNEQPEDVKRKLDELELKNIKDYQLKVIKRKRNYPQKGDVFLVEPVEGIYFYGIVVNNHISNINGDDLLVIMLFKETTTSLDYKEVTLDSDNLLIEPTMVGKEYWTRGYFYTVGNQRCKDCDYGFYSIYRKKYFDEYGKEQKYQPKLLGTYGVATISGIAFDINIELIIDEKLLDVTRR